jgi:AcrR family transcriptional regulator
MELFLRRGYGPTSMDLIAEASGIGRATLFRYFPSKAAIVWTEFDRTIKRLDLEISACPSEVSTTDAIRHAIVESTRVATENPTWLDRFVLIDTASELRRELSDHWAAWSHVISDFVSHRTRPDPGPVIPAAIGGAFQAAYVAVFRAWEGTDRDATSFLASLDQQLIPLCRGLDCLIQEQSEV